MLNVQKVPKDLQRNCAETLSIIDKLRESEVACEPGAPVAAIDQLFDGTLKDIAAKTQELRDFTVEAAGSSQASVDQMVTGVLKDVSTMMAKPSSNYVLDILKSKGYEPDVTDHVDDVEAVPDGYLFLGNKECTRQDGSKYYRQRWLKRWESRLTDLEYDCLEKQPDFVGAAVFNESLRRFWFAGKKTLKDRDTQELYFVTTWHVPFTKIDELNMMEVDSLPRKKC